MGKLLIPLTMLVTLAVGLITQTVQFTNGNSGLNNPTKYALGNIDQGTTLTFKITFPRPTAVPTNPTTFTPKLYRGLTDVTPSWSPQAVPTSPAAIELTWTCASTGLHFLNLQINTQVSVQIILLQVTKSGADSPYLAIADFLRYAYGNYFYLDTVSNINLTCVDCQAQISTHKLKDSDGISQEPVATGVGYSTKRQYSNQAAGFYRVEFRSNRLGPNTATFQTDPYECPYPPAYHDINQVFKGCVHAFGNQHSANAIQAHQCSPTQYYFNKTCHNADPTCNTFDTFSGFCYTCKNASIKAENGICGTSTRTVITCKAGTYPKGNVCIPNGCSGVDADGVCNGCLAITQEVVSGKCTTKTCPSNEILDSETGTCVIKCGQNQQKFDGICYNKPANCITMSRFLTCIVCENGHHFERGECKLDGGADNLRRR